MNIHASYSSRNMHWPLKRHPVDNFKIKAKVNEDKREVEIIFFVNLF